MRWRPSPATPVVVGAAFTLVGNLATNTVQVRAGWWPSAVWTAAAALVLLSVVIEVRRSRRETPAGPAAGDLGDAGQRPTLGRTVVVIALAVGVPVVAVARLPQLAERPLATASAVLLYEVVLLSVGFVGAIGRDLQQRWSARVAELVDAWLQRRTSRFTSAYLRYVRASNRYLDLKGLTYAEHALEMRDVLVGLALMPRPVHEMTADPIGQSKAAGADHGPAVTGTVWFWLRRAQRERAVLSIIGPPGSGKTTLLRYVAYTLARSGRAAWSVDAPRKIPIFVSLREHRDRQFDDTLTMSDLLRRSLAGLDRPQPPGWVEANLRRGNLLVLLDGLDEVPDADVRRSVSGWLERQLSSHPGNLLVVTSRPFGYRENPVIGAVAVEMQRFAPQQVTEFIRQWYRAVSIRSHGADNESARLAARDGATDLRARLDENPALAQLTVNPLLLTMIVTVHRFRGALPGSRSELYQEICEVFLGKRHQARGVAIDMPDRQKQTVLRALAHRMMIEQITEVREPDAARWIAPQLARVSGTLKPADFLRGVEDSAGLLIEKERGVYAFAHLTFQEYLAADHIRERGGVEVLVGGLGSSWWRETIRLYAAIADATPVVEASLDRRDDPEALALAVQCVEEAHEISQATRRRLDAYLNPPDARTDPAGRQLAARARLLLRAWRDQALPGTRLIGRTSVTWLEYQYFLDSTADSACRVPDHWLRGVYPAGADNEPAVGVRFEDAVAFCDWMRTETGSELACRPPHAEEIDAATARDGWDPGRAYRGYWTTSPPPSRRDVGFAQLARGSGLGQRHEPYRLDGEPPDRAPLDEILDADLAALGPALTGQRLEELVRRCWDDTAGLDSGQLAAYARFAEALARQYATTHHAVRGAAGPQAELRKHAEQTGDLLEKILDRSRYAERLGGEAIALRQEARRHALRAAASSILLFGLHGGGARLPAPGWLPKPTPRAPNPSRLPTVVLAALAHAFVGTYVDLVMLEARVTGRLAATESIIYVRYPQEAFGPREAEGPRAGWHRIKPVFDRVAGIALLAVLLPLMLAIAGIVRVNSRGPALFRQARIGKDGAQFTMYKFRTMYRDAEARLADLRHLNDTDGVLFKMRADPRVTPFGSFLRRWSLDELPNLFSVVRGDMSLVGPRPPLPAEVTVYPETARRRLLVRPGLTGLWQIMGRSDLSWEESVRLDLDYVDTAMLIMDVSILLRTLPAVWRGTGAY